MVAPEPKALSGVSRNGEIDRDDLEAIRSGDAAAFERVVRRLAPQLYRFARHLTHRDDEAEDLVQEALVRVLPALARFEGRATVSTYLLRAIANAWKNQLRSRSRSRIVAWLSSARSARWNADVTTEDVIDPADPAPSAFESLASAERAREVRAALERLDPARRLVLLLREVEDLSYEEIAEVTGVPVGTVRSRLARAREDLRRLLGKGVER